MIYELHRVNKLDGVQCKKAMTVNDVKRREVLGHGATNSERYINLRITEGGPA